MPPSRKLRSASNRFSDINEAASDKYTEHANKSGQNQKKRKLSDMLGPQWSKEELEHFYGAYRKYGKDWKKVASAVRHRTVEMVEALYTMNKAYLSLPEGIATVVGLTAMMTDHYSILGGSDSEQENIESAETSRKPQKHARLKFRSEASKGLEGHIPDFSQFHPTASGIRPHAVKKRTPQVPVAYSNEKYNSSKYSSPARQSLKLNADANENNVAHEIAFALTEASHRGGFPLVSRTPKRKAKGTMPSPVRNGERMGAESVMTISRLYASEMDEDSCELSLGSTEAEIEDYDRDEKYAMGREMQRGKGYLVKKKKIENKNNHFEDIKEACSGTQEGRKLDTIKGKHETKVAKRARSFYKDPRKKSKKALIGADEGSPFDALQTLADLSLMTPKAADTEREQLSEEREHQVSKPQRQKADPCSKNKSSDSSKSKESKEIGTSKRKRGINTMQHTVKRKKRGSTRTETDFAEREQRLSEEREQRLSKEREHQVSKPQRQKADPSSKKKSSDSSKSKESKEIGTSKRKRGINKMQHIVKPKKRGVKKVVEFNKRGQPRGKASKEMQSYIGVLARTKVSVGIRRWKEVEPETLRKIWEAVEMAFVIPPQCRKLVLSSAARKWRQFKCRLTKLYVFPNIDKEELLQDPPEEYNFIEKAAWDAFVAYRLTPMFKQLRKEQQRRRAQCQYSHRMSRLGYVGVEDHLEETMPQEDIDRAILWRLGREDKNGNIPDENTAKKAMEIEELKKQVAEGKLTVSGSNDILTMALGTAEHPGRVRGIGEYVTPTVYFNQPRRRVSETIRETVKELIAEEREKGLALAAKKVAEEREFWVQKFLELETKIDAKYKYKEQGDPIPAMNLTPPTLSVAHVSDKACCSAIKKPNKHDEGQDVNYDDGVNGSNKKSSLKPRNASQNLQPMPTSLKVMCRYAEKTLMVMGEALKFVMEAEVFGSPRITHILHEDILQFAAMKEISGTCIVLYMRYLYDVLKNSNMLSMVGFVDPAQVGAKGCGSITDRSRALATRFSTAHPNQIFLIPYNSGNHWMLSIVNLDKEIIYFMDSLKQSMINEEWKHVVNTGIKMYNGQANKQGRKSPEWKILMGTPEQPTYTECGYFVMRFMKEIVEDDSLDFAAKWETAQHNTYTQEQIDEVRNEWADYVSNYM